MILNTGFQAILDYYKFIQRIKKYVPVQTMAIKNSEKIHLLLLANEILICNNIMEVHNSLKEKIDKKTQKLSVFESALCRQIQLSKGEIASMKRSCQEEISKHNKSRSKQIRRLIDFLIKNDNFYRKNELIKLQILLRKQIGKTIKISKHRWKGPNEYELALHRDQFLILDFMISVLQLNGLLIGNDNDWAQFSKESRISQALDLPILTKQKMLIDEVIHKLNVLKLWPNQPKEKIKTS